MYRKTEERRQSLSSEMRNAFVVRNKWEQLKLEKQHKSLDRLRAHESLDLVNKKKEILSLQMSILFSKPVDNTEEICINPRQHESEAEVCINTGMRRMKLRSRALSISSSGIHTLLSSNGKDRRLRGPSLSSNGVGMNHYKKVSRSVSVSGGLPGLDYFTRRNWAIQPTSTKNEMKTDNSVEESGPTTEQAVWRLLPPIQLAPLYKQNSKSFKDMPSKPGLARKLSADNISWNELQNCRYLRRRWEH